MQVTVETTVAAQWAVKGSGPGSIKLDRTHAFAGVINL